MFLYNNIIFMYATNIQVLVNTNIINNFNGVTKNELSGLHDSHNLLFKYNLQNFITNV